MNRKAQKMVTIASALASATVLGTLLLVGGCGNDNAAGTTVTNANTIPATSVAAGASAGSLVVSAPVTAATASGATAISIPAGVTITPTGASFTASTPPVIDVSTYTNVTALPLPKTATYVVDSTAGAVEVSIGSASKVTFTGGTPTISIPLTGTASACEIFVNKNDGAGYKDLGKGTCSNGVATIKVTDLCTVVVDPIFKSTVSGSTGGTGSTGF